MGDDAKEGDETANNTSVEETPVEGEAPAAVEGEAPKEDAAPAEDKEPVEEEMKTLTLDEWKAQQKKEGPKFNLRKAGEGSDIDPKRKKKRWSTYRGLTGRRSWTLTSLSLTRIPAVEA